MEQKNKIIKSIANKTITIYPCASAGSPVIYLNIFANDGDQVYHLLKENGHFEFTLVTIGNLLWDHDMAPWDIPPISKKDTPCTGGADDYLKLLTDKILPECENEFYGQPRWRGLAGYSLAGLFAIYAMYRTDLFSRIASMSGSLWFPNFTEYVQSREMQAKPTHLYFSLGDKECHTRNPHLKMVQENTEKIAEFYKNNGLNTKYELNPGNHFQDAAKRTAKGISWVLSQ